MREGVKKGGEGVKAEPLNEQIAARLRAEVLSGRLPARRRLAQQELAARFQVSRIPVRDALRMLEAEGLITNDPRLGAVVTPMSIADLEELYEMRIALEPSNARRAVPSLRAGDDEAMRHHLQDMEAASDQHAWFEAHARFHSALNQRSGRTRTNVLLENLRGQTERYVRFFQMIEADPAALLAQHEVIRSAAQRRDAAAVETSVERHLELVRDKVMTHLEAAQRGVME